MPIYWVEQAVEAGWSQAMIQDFAWMITAGVMSLEAAYSYLTSSRSPVNGDGSPAVISGTCN